MTCCEAGKNEKDVYPERAVCPVNGVSYRQVKRNTLLHHLSQPQKRTIPEQGYYFCNSPQCDVVYFGEDGLVFDRNDIREEVGQKQVSMNRLLCYCFGIDEKTVQEELHTHGFSPSYDFVVKQTRNSSCACESRNPSGKCCLADFPKEAKTRSTHQ